jgi:hypothetical protein
MRLSQFYLLVTRRESPVAARDTGQFFIGLQKPLCYSSKKNSPYTPDSAPAFCNCNWMVLAGMLSGGV